ncbi:MAG: hypothetical protein LBG88_00390 [Christensenellaceae bacterium]|jgi:uncharacterized repeat protein (TIGR01451 family)|nr:hypothetical protein [Christensenellaceae bacterium]
MVIRNKAFVETEVCGKPWSMSSAETVVEQFNVHFESVQPCRFFINGSHIHYEFKLRNDNDSCVYGVRFKTVLQSGTQYVSGSFRVNGHAQHPQVHGNVLEFTIPVLAPHETVTISFDAVVADSKPCSCGCNTQSPQPYVIHPCQI